MFSTGFLGTDAGFITDFTLLAEIILFIAVCAGIVAQRRGKYNLHDWIQTPAVVLNLFLIVFVMVTSFLRQQVISTLPQRPGDAYYLVVAIHAGLGLVAEGLAIYVLLAGHKILPRRIGRLRYWMWATFGFWTLALIAGVATYYVWYMRPPEPVSAASQPINQPAVAQVLLQDFAFVPAELTITAGTQVTWANQDGAPHNVTFADGSLASDNFFDGETFANTFSEPGVYLIYCSLHGSPDGSGMTMTVTVLEEGAGLPIAAAPTVETVPPTPTPAPTVPPPPVALLEAETPQQTVVGLLSFYDTNAPGDSAAVLLSGIRQPQSGSTYHLWLTDSRSSELLLLGAVQPDGNGLLSLQYTNAEGLNLLGLYDGFQLTEEPQFDDNPAQGPVFYRGRQAPEALATIRAITVASEDAPLAYGLGARQQTEELLRHAELLQKAYDLLSIADARRHAEHIVNLLEGEQGEYYGDRDGAYGLQNPGDGFGILPYVTRMQDAAVQAANAPDTTHAIQVHSEHVVLAAGNALDWAVQIREAALEILAAERVGEIGPAVERLSQLSPLLLNGVDDNNDGEVAPAEGGVFTAYQHAQYMAAVPVVSEE